MTAKREKAAGFVMPAEWEPHEATWLSFPHNVRDWPGKFAPIPWVYGEIIRRLAPGERIELVVKDAGDEAKARRLLARVGVAAGRVTMQRFATNRIWARDTGPIFVRRTTKPGKSAEPGKSTKPAAMRGGLAIARFRFNAWAKYDDFALDDKVSERAAKALGVALRPVRHGTGKAARDVVLEGGSIDVDGAGTLLTTEECLMDPEIQVRNPGFSKGDYEDVFRDALGVEKTIWLGKGIAGDDTHGHVDDLARFVRPRTIVLCQEANGADANHRPLAENWERLQGARLAGGGRPEVVALPMPQPLALDGQRLPASYANFYIANAAVLVPTFNDPNDRVALGILAELFTDRPVIGIHAVDLVWGLGTLHCMSQQQPAA